MRVTNAAMYRNFSSSINSVHSDLNKSMNRVSSGKQYESAAENPLAYYNGKKIDNQYQNVLSQRDTITDIKNRIYQQELGARSIQSELSEAKVKIEYIRSDSNNGEMSNIDTIQNELLQKAQTMVNSLNTQYQNYYVFGGNDTSTSPFTLSEDGMTLTFNHVYPGEEQSEEVTLTLKKQVDGSYSYEVDSDDDWEKLYTAMKEQGRVDIGYGTISDKNTLVDTYTGGLNVLTGLTSDAVRAMADIDEFKDTFTKAMNNSALGLIGTASDIMQQYMDGSIEKSEFSSALGTVIDDMTTSEHNISVVYSDLGNKYNILENTDERLADLKITLEEQYEDILGADPYESITAMYSYQYAYNAALQMGSQMMQSTLFDFLA